MLPSDNPPPNSLESERAVLGAAILGYKEVWPEIRSKLTVDHFYHAVNQVLFRTIEGMTGGVDVRTVDQALRDAGNSEVTGGAGHLVDLMGQVPTLANVEHYIADVVEKYQRRKVIGIAWELATKAAATDNDVREASGAALRELCNLGARESDTRHIGEIVPSVMEEIEEQIANPAEITGLTTGYAMIDRITHGFKPGEFWIVAGLPGTGKTALAVEMACHCAERTKESIGIFSLEQKDRALVKRILASKAGVNMRHLSQLRHDAAAMQRLPNSAGLVSKLPVYINENARLTPSMIRGEIMLWVQRYNVKVVFLDYIQIVAQSRRGTEPRLHINEVSDELRSCAKEFGITVVGLSQFSREVEKQNRRPRNSDLKESGNLEADAHCILLLSRNVQEDELPSKWQGVFTLQQIEEFTHVNISKQREGDTLPVFLRFKREFTRYENIVAGAD